MKDTFVKFLSKRILTYYALLCALCVMSIFHYGAFSYFILPVGIILGIIFSDKKYAAVILSAACAVIIISAGQRIGFVNSVEGRECKDTFSFTVISYPEETKERIKCLAVSENSCAEMGMKENDRVFLYIYKENDSVKMYPGMTYSITGNLRAPKGATTPGTFDYKKYLLSENVFFTISAGSDDVAIIGEKSLPFMYEKILSLRRNFEGLCDKYMSNVSSSLLKGIMFASAETDGDVVENFRKLGISHVLAVSGLHLGIIYSFFMFLIPALKIKNKKMKYVLRISGCGFIIFYTALTGFSASCIRAAFLIILASSVSEDRILRGRYDTLSALCMIMIISMLDNPFVIFGTGFILSYLCVVSILLFNPVLEGALRKVKIFAEVCRSSFGEYIISLVSITISVQLGILPVSVIIFGESSLSGMVFNVLFVPVISLALIMGIISFVLPFLSSLILPACGGILLFVANMSDVLAEFAVYNITSDVFSPVVTVIYYAAVLVMTGYVNMKNKKTAAVIMSVVMMFCVLNICKYIPPKYSSVSFLDVGFGDSAIILTKEKECIIIDGGGGFYGGDTANEVLLPYLKDQGIGKISAMISTHSDADHAEGLLGLVGNIPIDVIYANDDGGRIGYELESLAKMHDIPVKELYTGDSLKFSDCEINILSPEKDRYYSSANDSSIVADVSVGGVKYLFMADADKYAERTVLRNSESFSLEYHILKASHHGSDFAMDELKLRLFCDVAVISVGNNGYGLPDENFISSMEDLGVKVLRTDKCGLIKIISKDAGKYDIMTYMGKWRKMYGSE